MDSAVSNKTNIVDKKLRKWQRDLINLGLRNKLLNFKPLETVSSKPSSGLNADGPKAPKVRQTGTGVAIIDELPEQIFKTLQMDGRSMTFLAAINGKHESINPEHIRHEAELGKPLDNKYVDTKLQTCLSDDKLGTTLLRLHQKANTSIEEQGINSLALALGLVEWYDEKAPDKMLRAPIVLLPVELVRRAATTDFSLKTTMEDPIINPALAEKLRLEYAIVAPELPESFEDFRADLYLKEFANLISRLPKWRVTEEVHLDIFSFAKYPMYKELEDYFSLYLENEKINDLCNGKTFDTAAMESIHTMELDAEFPPESCFHILDADSSQQRAILSAKRNYDLVIEGPPGTGKSQTITNIIADALSDQKSVLFVSEKMAALDVVFERLASRGLRDFCLKLHSQDSTKKAVYSELQRTLSTPEIMGKAVISERKQIGEVRTQLNKFVKNLHEPSGAMPFSAYTAIGRCAKLNRAPKTQATLSNVQSWSFEKFAEYRELLKEVAALLSAVGDPHEHAWFGCELLDYDVQKRNQLESLIQECLNHCRNIRQLSDETAAQLGTVSPENFLEFRNLFDVYRLASSSKGIDPNCLVDNCWENLYSDIQELVSSGQKFEDNRNQWRKFFNDDYLTSDLDVIANGYAEVSKKPFRFFLPSFWKLKNSVKAMRHSLNKVSDADLAAALQEGICAVAAHKIIANPRANKLGATAFGSHWNGPESNWADIVEISKWVVDVRAHLASQFITDDGVRTLAKPRTSELAVANSVSKLSSNLESLQRKIVQLIELASFAKSTNVWLEDDVPLEDLSSWLQRLIDNIPKLNTWCLFLEAVQKCRQSEIKDFALDYINGAHDPARLDEAFQFAFYTAWLHQALKSNEILRTFQSDIHSSRVSAFRRMDDQLKDDSQYLLKQKLAQRRHSDLSDRELSPELMTLQRELKKKARQMSVRRLLSSVPNTLRKIKPCFMMSPLSVAQYLSPDSHKFDLVVFDEASQITPEDALGSIIRGKQIIVVGDPKQLPPTNFFNQQVALADGGSDDDIEDSLESILDEFESKLYPCSRLLWHYRSKHQSLIAFSNKNFYGNQLISLPSNDIGTSERGLQYVHVDGTYEGSGGNSTEASHVADAVVEHIKKFPKMSLGVGTFNTTQQKLIMDAVDKRRQQDRSIEFFFENKGEDKFFVKNLENIQGDDRDVIFISCSFGKDSSGKVQLNLGPISQQNGKRRLNVLFTRAKYKMKVFASIRGDEIDLERAHSEGARLLREFLIFAESGRIEVPKINFDAEFDSSFEQAVYQALTDAGLKITAQVGQSGYRIDLGVLDENSPGRFLCGIECDGVPYHSSATARDRDRLRQQVLENLGWKLIRIWSLDWFHDQASQIRRVLSFVEDCKRSLSVEVESTATEIPEHLTDKTTSIALEQEPVQSKSAVPYILAEVSQRAHGDQFSQTSNAQIETLLLAICKVEAPIHVDDLMKKSLGYWGIARTGARIKRRLELCILNLTDRSTLLLKGEFVYWPSREVFLRSRENIDTTPELISPEEYDLCVMYAIHNRTELMEDALLLESAKLIGFKRTGQKLGEQILNAVERLKSGGAITFGACGLRLSDPSAVSTKGVSMS